MSSSPSSVNGVTTGAMDPRSDDGSLRNLTAPARREPGLVGVPPAFAERIQPVEFRAGRDLGGDELFLPLLLAGIGEDLRRQARREHDHAVVVA